MRTITSFHKEKNIICISLYDFNECPVFMRASTINILRTILSYNRNPIIITLYNFLYKEFLSHELSLYSRFINLILYEY